MLMYACIALEKGGWPLQPCLIAVGPAGWGWGSAAGSYAATIRVHTGRRVQKTQPLPLVVTRV